MPHATRPRPLLILGLVLCLFQMSLPLLAGEVSDSEMIPEDTQQAAPDAVMESPVPAKVYRYVERIFQKYDKDLDGVLAPDEWLGMRGYPILIAGSAEETITKDRMTDYVAAFGYRRRIRLLFTPMKLESPAPTLLHPSENGSSDTSNTGNETANQLPKEAPGGGKQFYVPNSHLPSGLPSWFFARDANGDGQLSLPEFAIDGTQSSMSEFDKLDIDHDGILSPRDLVKIAPKKPTPPKIKPATPSPKPVQPQPETESPAAPEPETNPAPDTKPQPAVSEPNGSADNNKRGQKRKRKRPPKTNATT